MILTILTTKFVTMVMLIWVGSDKFIGDDDADCMMESSVVLDYLLE